MIPSSIQVGAFKYTVILDKAAINQFCRDAGDNRVGEADHSKQTITIDPDLAPDQLADTLLHEVLHAISYNTGRILSDEKVVLALSPALLDTLRRNPDMVRFLLGDDNASP